MGSRRSVLPGTLCPVIDVATAISGRPPVQLDQDEKAGGDMPMRRRRPLRRAAVVGGVAAAAHHSGKKSAQAQAENEYQNQQISQLQAQQAQPVAPAAPPAAPAGVSNDMVTQLENLKRLLDDGVLTQAEFDMQKQKVLAGS